MVILIVWILPWEVEQTVLSLPGHHAIWESRAEIEDFEEG